MPRFQKKSELVEAVQFNPDQKTWPEYIHPWPQNRPVPKLDSPGYVITAEGKTPLMAGDWIVTSDKGKRTVCKPDVFEALYEEVI